MLEPLTPARAQSLLSPSARVLVVAADADGGASRAHSLPWGDVHWPSLLSITSFERAEAHIFRLMGAAPPGAVPDDVLRAIQAQYRVALFRAAEFGDAARVAVDAFAAAGVTALWLKGAALAMQSVEAFAVRSMGDLDVLVSPSELPAARAALRAAGWHDDVADASYEGHHHAAPMLWRGDIRLELHTGLFPPLNPFPDEPADAWFQRSRAYQWGERTVRVLATPWHVVHASVHWAWNHEGEVGTWQYLHDLARLTSAWGPNSTEWSSVAEHAEAINASLPVGWGLWSGSVLSEACNIDESVIGRLRGARRVSGGISERAWVLRAFQSPMASPSVRWSRYWWRQAMAGLGDASQAWPWRAGRTTLPVESEATRHGAQTTRRDAIQKWRRHLARVLGA